MWTIFKSLLNCVVNTASVLCFGFFFFLEGGRYETYGNLPPQLGIEPAPCALEEVSNGRKELDEGR